MHDSLIYKTTWLWSISIFKFDPEKILGNKIFFLQLGHKCFTQHLILEGYTFGVCTHNIRWFWWERINLLTKGEIHTHTRVEQIDMEEIDNDNEVLKHQISRNIFLILWGWIFWGCIEVTFIFFLFHVSCYLYFNHLRVCKWYMVNMILLPR